METHFFENLGKDGKDWRKKETDLAIPNWVLWANGESIGHHLGNIILFFF